MYFSGIAATVHSNEALSQLRLVHAWSHSSFSDEYAVVLLARAGRPYLPIQLRRPRNYRSSPRNRDLLSLQAFLTDTGHSDRGVVLYVSVMSFATVYVTS